MATYNPDKWVMLKFTNKGEVIYKILASWYGGFTTGDSWKLNSGCTKIEEDGQLYRFHGSSGSVYQVHKATYGMSGYTHGIYASFQKQVEDNGDPEITMELMPEDTNFMELVYE